MKRRRRHNVAASPRPHSWEQSTHEHSWEAAGDGVDWPSECSDDDIEDKPETPGGDLVEHMFGMLMKGSMSCQEFAVAMYYASKAGVKDLIASYLPVDVTSHSSS